MPHCWRAFGPRQSRAIRGFNLDTAHFSATSAALLAMRAEVLRGERSVLGPALDLKHRASPPINCAPLGAPQRAFHPLQKNPFLFPAVFFLMAGNKRLCIGSMGGSSRISPPRTRSSTGASLALAIPGNFGNHAAGEN